MNPAYLAEPADWLRDSVVQVRQGASAGSGLAWGWDLVVTSAHVAHAGEVDIVLPGGECRRGIVRACDRARDVAVLSVPGLGLPAAQRRDPSALRRGKKQRGPELKKKAQEQGPTRIRVDASGLNERPLRCWTWAPQGQTPSALTTD